ATTFTFASPPTISASATFGVRIWRTGSRDTSNYISIASQAANVYAGGSTWSYNGITTTWAAGSVDAKVIVNSSITLATDAYYFFGRDGTTATTLQAYKAGAPATLYTITVDNSQVQNFGLFTVYKLSQSFTCPSGGGSVGSVKVNLVKAGNPTDNLQIDILATNGAGQPTGSSLGTATVIAGSSLTTTMTQYTFTFPTPVTLTGSTQYAVVISRTGSNDNSNSYGLGTQASGDPAQSGCSYNGTAWGSTTTPDAGLVVIGPSGDATTGWSSIATRTGFTTAVLNIAGYQVGNVIHLAVQDGTMASSVATKYLSFDAATDTFLASTETVLAASSIATAGGGNAGQNCSLVVRSNGNAVIFYNGTQAKVSGTFYSNVWYRERTGVNTYGTAVQVSAATAFDNSTPFAVLGAANRVHFAWTSGATTAWRTLSAANAQNTAGSTASMTAPGDGVSYDRSGTTKVVFTSNVNGSQGTLRLDSSDNPTVTFANQSIAAATIPHRIGVDISNDEVTIAYRSS